MSEESLLKTKDELVAINSRNDEEVLVLPTLVTDFTKERRNGDIFKVHHFLESLKGIKFDLVEVKQVESRDLSEFEIVFGHDQKIWCNDSYLKQSLLSKGAVESDSQELDSTLVAGLSLYHDVHLIKKEDVYQKNIAAKIWKFLKANPVHSNHTKLSAMEDPGFDEYIDDDLLTLALELRKYKNVFNSEG